MYARNVTLDRSLAKRDFEQNRMPHEKLKRDIPKSIDVNFPTNVATVLDLMSNE